MHANRQGAEYKQSNKSYHIMTSSNCDCHYDIPYILIFVIETADASSYTGIQLLNQTLGTTLFQTTTLQISERESDKYCLEVEFWYNGQYLNGPH